MVVWEVDSGGLEEAAPEGDRDEGEVGDGEFESFQKYVWWLRESFPLGQAEFHRATRKGTFRLPPKASASDPIPFSISLPSCTSQREQAPAAHVEGQGFAPTPGLPRPCA